MDKIVIRGSRGVDGEYEFDIDGQPLTALEWRWIKKISGYLPLTIEEGRKGGDPDIPVAFAVIALVRSGKVEKGRALLVAEQLADLAFDGEAIELVAADGDEDGPPTTAPPTSTGQQTPDGGEASKQTSGSRSASSHPDTGTPD